MLEKVLDEQGESLPTPWRSRLHHQLASLEHTRGRYEPALKHWEQSMPIDRRNGNVLGLAAVLGRLGAIHYLRGEREKAAELYRQSLRIWEEINDRGGVARMQNNIGLVYKLQNRLEEAEACFRRCLAILKELGPRDEEAIALGNLSDIMMMTGNFPLALDYSLRGLEIRKPLGNRSGIAFSYYRIGLIYRTQGELDRAADYVQKSLEIRRELDEKNNLSYSLKLLGDLEVTRGRYFEGYRYLRQSLSHCEALGNRAGRCTLLTALAMVYRLVGMHEEAVSHAGEAVEIARDDHLDYYVGSALLCQAVNHLELGELSAAEGVLEEAEQIFRSQRSRRELAMVLLEKARLALELGNLERGISILAEAYTTVEELGLLDLYPPYYRLRGAFAASGHGPDLALARKLLERGLEEAQRLDLPDEIWRDHRLLALLEERCGNRESADQHLRLAVEGVRGIGEPLPGQFRASYFDSGEQAELLADWESRGSEGLTPAREEIPEEPPPQPADGGLPAEDLARLQEVVLLLTSERDLQILLDRILDEVLKLFNAERGFLILTDGADHEIRAARNIDREEVERPELKYSRSIAEEVARTGETFLTNEAQRDERLLEAHSVHDLRLQAIACFPLVWQGERLGVIYIENRFRKQILPPERVKLLEAFSVQAALTIVNARLDEENRRRTEELERSKLEIEELNQRLEVKVVEQSKELEVARREIERKQDQLEDRYRFHNILGASPRMQTIYQLLSRISATELPVLVEGESGTGKELVAQAIHFNSARRRAPFVSENCGALTESLFESELFGHQRGAFTGADRDREGLFALAESGTLFLDEIHELSLDSQGKLLRVLQDGVYRPVGGKQFLRADVRILSASNQPLLGQVQTGRFREDLYYRLNVLRVDLPPLRERGADVILLARHFLTQVTESEGLPRKELSQEAMRLLSRYRYPGNVRELRNLIEKAAVLSDSELIMEDDLFFDEDPRGAGSPLLPSRSALDLPLKEAREGFQRDYVEQMLLANRGVVSRAAAQAGITRESFHRLMKKHGIRRVPRKGR
ncbi:MAG: sigma 54-interacting transcriptional regulator [Planctomycetota bacterium]